MLSTPALYAIIIQQNGMQRKLLTILAITFFALIAETAVALISNGEIHIWSFDAVTIEKGYTVSTPDDQFFVGVLPNVLKGQTDVTIKVFDHVDYTDNEIYRVGPSALVANPLEEINEEVNTRLQMNWALPEGKEIVSPIYEFDIKGAAELYDPTKPLWLRFHYQSETLTNLGVYYWHKGEQAWIPIPTTKDESDMSLKAAIHLTYAPMAILSDYIPSIGEASWYAYQDCNCAASRHYPYGTLLKVTDLITEKSVVVEVNDYGPEEWTGRIIDLDLVAFEQLTEKWRGLTRVKVEPYLITEEEFNNGALPDLF